MNYPYRLAATWLPLVAIVFVPFPSRCSSAPLSWPVCQTTASAAPTAEDVGNAMMARGRYAAALDAYSRAPVDAQVMNEMGVAWHHLGALDRARGCYQQSLALRPDYPEALNNLASVDFARGHYRDALRLYQRAFRLNPQNAFFAANLGVTCFALHMPEQGLVALHTAYALDPTIFDSESMSLVPAPVFKEVGAREDYSLAVVCADHRDYRNALFYLRRAVGQGFHDWKRLATEAAFKDLRQSPEFSNEFTGLLPSPP